MENEEAENVVEEEMLQCRYLKLSIGLLLEIQLI